MPTKIPEPEPIQVLDETESAQERSDRAKQLADIERLALERQKELRKTAPGVRVAELERCPRKAMIAEAIATGAIKKDEHPCFLPPSELRKRAMSGGYRPVHDPKRAGEFYDHDGDILTACPQGEHDARVAHAGRMSSERLKEPTEESKHTEGMVTEEVTEGETVTVS